MGQARPKYIVVERWDEFQHYKDRRPAWIKNYLELRDNTEYLRLSGPRRALLHGVWLEYAARCTCSTLERDLRCTCLPLDLHLLNSSLRLHAKMADLEALSHAGFLRISASKSLASRKQVAPDSYIEKEREKDKGRSIASYEGNGLGHFQMPASAVRH